jgi:phage terminase small subunit
LKNVEIQKAIKIAMDSRAVKSELTAERVLKEICCLALYDPAEIAKRPMNGPKDICKLPENVRRAIIGWSWDKNRKFVLKLSKITPKARQKLFFFRVSAQLNFSSKTSKLSLKRR